jgi:hypothetical protein
MVDVKSRNAALRIAVALFGIPLLCACAVMPEPQITSLLDVPPDKTVIIGRIELHPPLREDEQVLRTARGEELKNAFILYCGDRPRDLKTNKPGSYDGSFATVLEKDYFIQVDKGIILYVPGGTFYSIYDPPYRVVSHTFSSPFQIELRPDDEAVYIGTIQYYRDDSNNLTSVTIRDDYQWADSQFKERFGTNKNLRKALLTPSACCK